MAVDLWTPFSIPLVAVQHGGLLQSCDDEEEAVVLGSSGSRSVTNWHDIIDSRLSFGPSGRPATQLGGEPSPVSAA